jgi:hypothetical protein
MRVHLNKREPQWAPLQATSALIMRTAPLLRLFGSLAMVALLAQTGSAGAASSRDSATLHAPTENATDQPNISGIWSISPYVFSGRPQAERQLLTLDGSPAPAQPWAAKIYKDRMDGNDAGHPFAPTVAQCLPGGMPAMMLGPPYPFQIIQSPGQVTFIHEENRLFRVVRLNDQHPDDPDPTYMGDSVGHWEGDTLVVDTLGLKDITTMDFNGMPHSEDLHIVEHIRRLKPDQLEILFTFTDPKTFTKTWQMRRTYKLAAPGEHIMEYICENQRNTPNENGVSGFGK